MSEIQRSPLATTFVPEAMGNSAEGSFLRLHRLPGMASGSAGCLAKLGSLCSFGVGRLVGRGNLPAAGLQPRLAPPRWHSYFGQTLSSGAAGAGVAVAAAAEWIGRSRPVGRIRTTGQSSTIDRRTGRRKL